MGTPLRIAVVGAGPVGLALALLAARTLPQATLSLFDARPAEADVSGDARTLALSLGSVQLLERLDAWAGDRAEPIRAIRVSQQPAVLPVPSTLGAARVHLSAQALGVPMLGAVVGYGTLVAPMRAAWLRAAATHPQRLITRFGTPVAALKDVPGGVEVDAGVVETFDLAVVAEGGVFGEQRGADLQHDYGQDAWVGTVTLADATPGLAVEHFTRHGPAALLPLPPLADGMARAALVWCVDRADDPVRELDDAQRLAVLAQLFDPEVGRVVGVSPLKRFPLGLAAHRSLVRARQVRIGNAAQTLHPVAGQGLNLGLRDAFALTNALRDALARDRHHPDLDAALRHVAWQRAPDRWTLIAATDFLARSFTWNLPGLDTARGLGLALLDRLPLAKAVLARQMMFGRR
ncbi:MAG TPA: FAD-dependent monooxygenase [Burkholderiaceae bacterium]|nr:FAD-dependent monooxygenase [Burkholderiaceae bacterium]